MDRGVTILDTAQVYGPVHVEMVAGECGRQRMERADFRFSRRDVRAFTAWGDTQLKVHLQRPKKNRARKVE